MKISIMCESSLLQEALKYYLQDFISDLSECDFVISDRELKVNKPLCLIGDLDTSHIKKPFTPASLWQDIKTFQTKAQTGEIAQKLSNLLDIKDSQIKIQVDSLLEELSTKIRQTLKKEND